MKRYLVLIIIAFFLVSCGSQKRQVSRNIEQGYLQEAYDQLQELLKEEGALQDPEVWLIKADLYMHAFESEVPEYKELVEDPLGKAKVAIDKADELDINNMNLLQIQQKRLILSEQMFNYGLSYYENEDFAYASDKFFISFQISEQFDAKDTMTLFNAALAAEQAQLYTKSQKYYKLLVDLEFEEPYVYIGVSNSFIRLREKENETVQKYDAFINAYEKKDRINEIFEMEISDRDILSVLAFELDIHQELAELIKEKNPQHFEDEKISEIMSENESLKEIISEYEENAIYYLKKGRERFPDDIELIFGEANFYLMTGRTEDAREILNLAIEREPDNASLHFAFGANFEKMADDDLLSEEERENALKESIAAYERAIELNDEFVDAMYNLGALYFNQGIKIFEKADEELRKTRDFQKYQEAEKEINKFWLKAQPYLENAKELIEPDMPGYHGILASLMQLYARTNQQEKQEAIEKEYRKHFDTEE